ncbi:hypothetical protein KAX29_06840, partial [candidate division WOR-3 bacterium]|nr:hypothetical protein [candidate division WOR-3 bacterium]
MPKQRHIRKLEGALNMSKKEDRVGKGVRASNLPPPDKGVNIMSADYVVEYQSQALIQRFGDLKGKLCYEAYYGRKEPCGTCRLKQSTESGRYEAFEVIDKDNRTYEFQFI